MTSVLRQGWCRCTCYWSSHQYFSANTCELWRSTFVITRVSVDTLISLSNAETGNTCFLVAKALKGSSAHVRSWGDDSIRTVSCRIAFLSSLHQFNIAERWHQLTPVWYTTEWYITCLIHHWVSITLTAADTWLSCSAVVQNCKNGWQFIWHLLTCWCHKFHSSITVAVAAIKQSAGCCKKKKKKSLTLVTWKGESVQVLRVFSADTFQRNSAKWVPSLTSPWPVRVPVTPCAICRT